LSKIGHNKLPAKLKPASICVWLAEYFYRIRDSSGIIWRYQGPKELHRDQLSGLGQLKAETSATIVVNKKIGSHTNNFWND
jgi:hypothetical protein